MAHDTRMDAYKRQEARALIIENLRPLAGLLTDDSVQEIMINGPSSIWIERAGEMQPVADLKLRELDMQAAHRVLSNMMRPRRLNVQDADDLDLIMDCEFDGMRVCSVLPPVAPDGPILAIRRHRLSERSVTDYLAAGAFDVLDHVPETMAIDAPAIELRHGGAVVAEWLQWAVESRKNILASGGTSTGKTTWLNALLALIPSADRVLTLEDTLELKTRVPNLVRLRTIKDLGITIRRLIKVTLRLRPDRIIVGEVRGEEAYDLLDALGTGHEGGLATLHANNSFQALGRLENLVRTSPDMRNTPIAVIREQIASTFNYVIQLSRHYGTRGPSEIREVLGVDRNGQYVTRLLFSKVLRDESFYQPGSNSLTTV